MRYEQLVLCLCAYYRRFVANFSKIPEPLTRLAKGDIPFVWKGEQCMAFEEPKRRLQTTPIVGHLDKDPHTELHTDASNIGLGSVLGQWG